MQEPEKAQHKQMKSLAKDLKQALEVLFIVLSGTVLEKTARYSS